MNDMQYGDFELVDDPEKELQAKEDAEAQEYKDRKNGLFGDN